LTPGPGPEIKREIRRRTTFMRMVNPTLSTIQNKHPLVAHPLPPPPNTMMKRFTIHMYESYNTKISRLNFRALLTESGIGRSRLATA
jgi:hypothetical protein